MLMFFLHRKGSKQGINRVGVIEKQAGESLTLQYCTGNINEPRHEKTCLWGFRPGKTQTDLLNYID